MDLMESFSTLGNDVMLFSTLVIVLVLVVLAMNQRFKYQKLKENVDEGMKRVNEQDGLIKKLENDLREYVMGGKSLREWKIVKQQIDELSDLPSFSETEDGYILKMHLSMTKKDDVRVSGVKNGIKVVIGSKDEPPLSAFYATPRDIDPNGLKVTYKGNSLEIRATKATGEEEKKE